MALCIASGYHVSADVSARSSLVRLSREYLGNVVAGRLACTQLPVLERDAVLCWYEAKDW